MNALYVCYLSLDDPLTHTQVVAYLEGLARRGHEIHLLTYEHGRLTRARRRRIREALSARGIRWHGLRYHRRPSLPATVGDALAGVALSVWLIRRHGIDVIHARTHVPAAAGLLTRRLTGARLVFDIRGLMAEEYEDAGRWRRTSLAFRLTKRVERAAIRRAAGIVVLTARVRDHLFGAQGDPRVTVIPCCTPVDGLAAARVRRDATRRELGLEGVPVLVYVGKLTGWYMDREMARFFAAAREVLPGLRFLVLTQHDPGPILRELGELRREATVTSAPPEEVGRYLAAADLAISFIRPSFSKISSSPTKVGEYLAAGLPIVHSAGVGDVDALLDGHGVLVRDYSPAGLRRAAIDAAALMADPGLPDRCRSVARRELDLATVGIERYGALYARVAASIEANRDSRSGWRKR